MKFRSTDDFLLRGSALRAKGPIALIFIEDNVEVASTVAHHRKLGFRQIVLFCPEHLDLADSGPDVATVVLDPFAKDAVPEALSAVMAATPPTTWIYWGYNAEYLMFPFCEARTIGEMLAFQSEERRQSMLCYVVDLYASDLSQHPDAVSLDQAMFDKSGYYAATRFRDGVPQDRQLEIFGGIRWRYEEHVPWTRRRIDRIALFRPQKGVTMRPDFTFTEEEMNTISCPWHHNMTASVASFRAAKALRTNPGSRWAIQDFTWCGSTRFEWSSQQLLELGLMESGQWF